MSLFEAVDQVEGCLLIVNHVLLPSARELHHLVLLRLLNAKQLILLGYPHIVGLPLLLVQTPLLEDGPH